MAPLMFILGLMLTIAGCELSEGGLDCKVAVDYGPIGLGIATNQRNPPAPPPPPPSPPKETATVTRIRVHGRLQEAEKLVKRVLPEYPASGYRPGASKRKSTSVQICRLEPGASTVSRIVITLLLAAALRVQLDKNEAPSGGRKIKGIRNKDF